MLNTQAFDIGSNKGSESQSSGKSSAISKYALVPEVCLSGNLNRKKRHSTNGSRLTVSQFFHNMTTRNFN